MSNKKFKFLDPYIAEWIDINKRNMDAAFVFALMCAIVFTIIGIILFFVYFTSSSYIHSWDGNKHLTSGGNWSYYKPKTGNYGPSTPHNSDYVAPLVILVILSIIAWICVYFASKQRKEVLLSEWKKKVDEEIRLHARFSKTYKQPYRTNEWKIFRSECWSYIKTERTFKPLT